MAYRTIVRLAPQFTPRPIKFLLAFTAACSLGAVIWEQVSPGPMALLVFSKWGILNGYLWQFASYLFVLAGNSITPFWLLNLFVLLYMLWFMGTDIVQRVGASSFYKFYIACGALSAAAALIASSAVGVTNFFYSGPGSAILGLFVVWALHNPAGEVRLYFLLPIKARYLLYGTLAAVLLINISQFAWVSLAFYLTAMAVGYIYAKIKFGRIGWRWRGFFQKKLNVRSKKEEAFVNRMLDKVSKHGEKSLTKKERAKLHRLTKNKH